MKQLRDVGDIGGSGRGRDGEVSGGNESEEHDEAEERKGEEQVDADSADEEDEACDAPCLETQHTLYKHTLSHKDGASNREQGGQSTYMVTLWKP